MPLVESQGPINCRRLQRIESQILRLDFRKRQWKSSLKNAAWPFVSLGYKRLCVGGGVAANQMFRDELQRMANRERIEVLIAPMELCTDNAAMAAIAWDLLASGRIADLNADVLPGLVRYSDRDRHKTPLKS
jgi:tRNA A37 threonylcarbamoyltransferase TsaD